MKSIFFLLIGIELFLSISTSQAQDVEKLFSLGVEAAKNANLVSAMNYFNSIIEIDPEFTSAYFQRSLIYWQIEDFENSLNDLNKCIALDKNFPDAFLFRARIHKEIGDLEKALDDYNSALRNEPKNIDALYERAQLKFMTDRTKDAIDDLNQIIELNPNDIPALTQKALILDAMDQFEEAESILTSVINLNIEDRHLSYFFRGLVRSKMDDDLSLFRAEQDFSKALELNKDFVDAYIKRGQLRIRLESIASKKDGIQDLITSVKLDKTSLYEIWEDLVSARKSLNDYSGIITDLNEISTNYPDDWEVKFISGRAKQEFSNYYESISDFEEVIKSMPDIPYTYYWIGVSYFNIENFAIAKSYAYTCRDKLLAENQIDSSYFHSTYYLITNCNQKLFEYDEALAHMDTALTKFPTSAGLLSNKSYYLNIIGKYNEALSVIEKGLKYAPGFPQLYKNRAFSKFKLGNLSGAMNDIENAINLNPFLAEAYYYRALFNFEIDLSQKNKICEDIIKAKELGYLDLDPKLEKFCE